jgi:hypothetical protein
MRSKTPTFAEHLKHPRSQLTRLLGHISHLAEADSVLRQALGPPLSDRVHLANLRNKVAIVHTDCGATSTLLRFRQQEILEILTKQANIACDRVLIKIDPSLSKL